MIDVPRAVAAAGSDRHAEGILQGASLEGGIDAGLSHGASKIRGEDRPLVRAHQRCASSHSAIHASQTTAMTASADNQSARSHARRNTDDR